jgi:hypothetical protein
MQQRKTKPNQTKPNKTKPNKTKPNKTKRKKPGWIRFQSKRPHTIAKVKCSINIEGVIAESMKLPS